MRVYESEGYDESLKSPSMGEVCKAPPRRFNVEMFITETFDQGFQVGAKIDGILCLTQADALACFTNRLKELWVKWEEAKLKI